MIPLPVPTPTVSLKWGFPRWGLPKWYSFLDTPTHPYPYPYFYPQDRVKAEEEMRREHKLIQAPHSTV